MSEALRQIKSHLGPEAMLLSTKEVPRRSGVWGSSSGFEVVAAVDNGAENIDVFSPSHGHETAIERHSVQEPVRSIIDEVTIETYSPAGLISNAPALSKAKLPKAKNRSFKADLDVVAEIPSEQELPFKGRAPIALYQDLVKCGVDPSLACELLVSALDSLAVGQRRSRPALLRSVTNEALTRVADPSTQNGMPQKKVVAFFGPAGVGKTTSIAKLAARLALQNKKKVVLMTLDGYRIGAIEQLRSYAGLMGIPFRFVDQVSELSRAIEENMQRDYILIDTAGHGPRELGPIRTLASFLTKSGCIERHLVLSAATKPSDMRNAMDRFEICLPDHLLFTKLDETSTPGPILNELVRTQKSFSYYTNGQKVPDDLHAVPKERIIDIMLNQNENGMKA